METISNEEAEGLYATGYNLFTKGEYDDAKNLFLKIVSMKPNIPSYWRALGAVNQQMKDFSSAIAAYNISISIKHDDVISLVYRGECYILSGDTSKGLQDMETAISVGVSYPEYSPWAQRASMLLDTHKDPPSDKNVGSITSPEGLQNETPDCEEQGNPSKGQDKSTWDKTCNYDGTPREEALNSTTQNSSSERQKEGVCGSSGSSEDSKPSVTQSDNSSYYGTQEGSNEDVCSDVEDRYINVEVTFNIIDNLASCISSFTVDPQSGHILERSTIADDEVRKILNAAMYCIGNLVLCENEDIDKATHDVLTECDNMIINGANVATNGMFNEYFAISHVSNGSRLKNLKFVILGKELNVRCSNDRLKYKAVMEYVDREYKGKKVWTDHISMEQDYKSQKKRMIAIGNAYSIASKTIVPLDSVDAGLLTTLIAYASVLSLLLNIMSLEKVYSPETAVRRYQTIERSSIKLDDVDWLAAKKIIHLLQDIKDATNLFYRRSDYSYWSRAWTMQEQLMSSDILYGAIINGSFHPIIDEHGITELLCRLYPIKALLSLAIELEGAEDSKNAINNISVQLWSLLPSTSRIALALFADKQNIVNIEDTVMSELCENVKCAKSKNEFNEAVGIALRIEADSSKELWRKIVMKMVDNSYIPEKKMYGKYNGRKWWPEGATVKYRDNRYTGKYYSVVLAQFVKLVAIRRCAVLSENDNLILKLPVVYVNIKWVAENNNTQNMYIFNDLKLVEGKNRRKYNTGATLIVCGTHCEVEMSMIVDEPCVAGQKITGMLYNRKKILILSKSLDNIVGNAKFTSIDTFSQVVCRSASAHEYVVLGCP